MSNKTSQMWVPVISSTGEPLMPCSPRRARKLIKNGKAVRKWSKGKIFYIKLLHRETGELQPLSLGIDPGSKMEGYSITGFKRIFINIQSHAVDSLWIKKKMDYRRMCRHGRKKRQKPYRQPRWSNRGNRNRTISSRPSIASRWNLKLNILTWLEKLYPIVFVTVENSTAALRKKCHYKWNSAFSPILIGKNWFYSKMYERYGDDFTYVPGNYTREMRNLYKVTRGDSSTKITWRSHCVDAFALAASRLIGVEDISMRKVIELVPRKISRRQLHYTNRLSGNNRMRYGGTIIHGTKKGTIVTHPIHGTGVLSGVRKNGKISITSICTGKRLTRDSKFEDLKIHHYSQWILR